MTTPGIEGAGFIGFAFEQLLPPVQSAPATSTSGGTLPTASVYKYVITAINANGETGISNEQTVTTGAGGTNSNTVNWVTVTGATGFKIYRTAAGGATGTELLLTSVGLVVTFVDTGALTPAGALPVSNTASTPNTYQPPVKYFPVLSETLKHMQTTQWRKPIRQLVDVLGAVQGDVHTEGDIVVEALPDVVPYFHCIARATTVKTGATSPFTYTSTPNINAVATDTASITIIRNGVVFGYTGCVVSQFKYAINNGILQATFSLIGSDEAVQSSPTSSYANGVPFGEGQYELQLPTPTVILDADGFDFTVNDNATPNFRMRNTGRGATFVSFGERAVTADLTRDFLTRADYDAYKTLASQGFQFKAMQDSNNIILITAPATIKNTHETNLSGQGNVVRSKIAYVPILDSVTGRAYQVAITTTENFQF